MPSRDDSGFSGAFRQCHGSEWREDISDSCAGDWKQRWFLDGEIATVKTDPEGMELTAGPEFGNDARHMALWTKTSFVGVVERSRPW